MSELLVIPSGEGPVGSGFVCLRRIVAEDGTGTEVSEEGFCVKADDIDGDVSFSLYDMNADPLTAQTTDSLTPSDVFVDLVNDNLWTRDSIGYNFKYEVSASEITEAHLYRAIFIAEMDGGAVIEWAHDYQAISLLSAPLGRISEADLRAIIKTSSSIELAGFLADAHVIIESLSDCMAGQNDEGVLAVLEKYVAAHLYALRDQQYQSKNTGRAGATFMGQYGMGLESTSWGQMAKRLDQTGCLASLDRTKQRVGGAWLGKPPTQQIPYRDRR